MYMLRTLGIRDVLRAVKQRKLRVALRITQCLASNGVNTVRFRLRLRPHLHVRRAVRRAP
jgi:hypothetical protein